MLIIHQIPIPEAYACRRKYHFEELFVGGCFFVPCKPGVERRKKWNVLTSSRRRAQIKYGTKYVIRTVTGGLMVGRVE